MCGFSGELRTDGQAAEVTAVARMAETMHRRGPDGAGVYAQGSLALGHRRLKIIDLSDKAAQPMIDPELGLGIVFNGCIYNYPQLRRELADAGYRFFSTGDTEVLLKAYDHWGDAFVQRLHGMFAFALWERDTGRLVLGRDRLGIKPLYVARMGRRMRFASTVPGLLAGGDVDTSIDPIALHHYLCFHAVVPPPHTIFAGVSKLPPASLLVVEPDGTERTETFWQPRWERDPERSDWTAEDWQDAVHTALRTAVQRRLVADGVPIVESVDDPDHSVCGLSVTVCSSGLRIRRR
jgi:asparagine synthase (glutamine-hydrolysing)